MTTYVTGDTHGNFNSVIDFCCKANTLKDDILIILGDAGINYYGGKKDRRLKKELPLTIFSLHGNHERRPESIPTYCETEWQGGIVYAEPEFLSLLFAKDGEIYDLNNKKCLAVGGAYSVDKHYRLANNWSWWNDEQPSDETKKRVEKQIDANKWRVDAVLSHTCPFSFLPTEMFIKEVDQSAVDHSTEKWLQTIETRLTYTKWYCVHFHTDKIIDKIRFMFNNFIEL